MYGEEAPARDRAEAVRQASEFQASGKLSEAAAVWDRLLREDPQTNDELRQMLAEAYIWTGYIE